MNEGMLVGEGSAERLQQVRLSLFSKELSYPSFMVSKCSLLHPSEGLRRLVFSPLPPSTPPSAPLPSATTGKAHLARMFVSKKVRELDVHHGRGGSSTTASSLLPAAPAPSESPLHAMLAGELALLRQCLSSVDESDPPSCSTEQALCALQLLSQEMGAQTPSSPTYFDSLECRASELSSYISALLNARVYAHEIKIRVSDSLPQSSAAADASDTTGCSSKVSQQDVAFSEKQYKLLSTGEAAVIVRHPPTSVDVTAIIDEPLPGVTIACKYALPPPLPPFDAFSPALQVKEEWLRVADGEAAEAVLSTSTKTISTPEICPSSKCPYWWARVSTLTLQLRPDSPPTLRCIFKVSVRRRVVGAEWHSAASHPCVFQIASLSKIKRSSKKSSLYDTVKNASFLLLLFIVVIATLLLLARSATATLVLLGLLVAGSPLFILFQRRTTSTPKVSATGGSTAAKEESNCGCLRSFIPQALLSSMKLQGVRDAINMGMGGCYKCD